MPNTLHGPYAASTWVDGTTALNQTRMSNLEKQNSTALASFNPDLIGSGFILSGVAASRHNNYASTVLADNPVGYYRLDDAIGSVAALDSSTNGLALAYFNSPGLGAGSLLTGDNDTSVLFTAASSQYAAGTDSTGLPTGNGTISIECFIKFSANPASTQNILMIGDRATAGHFLGLQLGSVGQVAITNSTVTITSAALTTGVRHHLVGTYDGTNLRLYIDNVLVGGPTAATNALSYTGNTLTLGSQSGATPAAYFNGQIDEAAVYASALSATRITAHWTAGTTATTQLDVSSGTAYLVQSDGTPARCDVVSTNFTTVTINTTYFLDLNPDGSWSWGTAHSAVANHLTIASVATDNLGNTVTVTDLRPLNVTLLPNLAGHVQSNALPQIVGSVSNASVTSTADQKLLSMTAPATGIYRGSLYFSYRNPTPQLVTASFRWFDVSVAAYGSASPMIISSSATGTILNGSQAANTGNNQPVACMPVVFYAGGGQFITFHFMDPGGTPNDVVSVVIERLT